MPTSEDESNDNSLDGGRTNPGGRPPVCGQESLSDEKTIGHHSESQQAYIDDMELVDLGARYEITGTLGEGGMGSVVIATDRRLLRQVAIKRIVADLADSARTVERFIDEARSIAAMGSHPNVLQVFDYGRSKDGPFIVMEYVDGGSLLDLCKLGPLNLEKAISLFTQVCDGLERAHGVGIIHRDLKPANILLTAAGIPKIADFGLVKTGLFHRLNETGSPVGTPDFMPPEQWANAALVDHRSDLWSLGATLYQVLSGRSVKVIRLAELPEAIRPVISKVLEDKKELRFQSAVELKEALLGALANGRASSEAASADSDVIKEGECPVCHAMHTNLSRKFCKKCGQSLRVDCLGCGTTMSSWESICGECGGRQADLHEKLVALRFEESCLLEAREHFAAFDYPAASRSLNAVPQDMRREETVRMLADCSARREESTHLINKIVECYKEKQFDGLLPVVRRAVELRGDREDLRQALNQLTTRRDMRLSRVVKAMDAGDARAAEVVLKGAAAEDFDQSAGLLSRVQNAVLFEDAITYAVANAKKNGAISPQEASEILQLCQEYISLNPKNEKLWKLISQCKKLIRFRNSIGLNLTYIPAGSFVTGGHTAAGKKLASNVDIPNAFFIGTYPVTESEWKRVMGGWRVSSDRPICPVRWRDAVAFCDRLSALSEERAAGRMYRLPTDAEWEYACRAGSTAKYFFGEDENILHHFAWFLDNSRNGQSVTSVGMKRGNAWGLHDMHGTVWEWCGDAVAMDGLGARNKSSNSNAFAALRDVPAVQRTVEQLATHTREEGVICGGSWKSPADECQSAVRGRYQKAKQRIDNDVGLRVVLDVTSDCFLSFE